MNFNEARRQANIVSRAKTLFTDAGYTYHIMDTDIVFVIKPGVDTASYMFEENSSYEVNPVSGKCKCPDFLKHNDFCKHLLAVQELPEVQDAVLEAQWAAYELTIGNAETADGCDAYAEF